MTERVRILLVDDHPVFRLGLRNLLQGFEDLEVAGEASSGEDALELAGQLKPDLVLMDIGLPGMNGLETTRCILETLPETAILILTMFDDDSVFDAVKAGARGYLLKGADPDETIRAIRSVANGEAIFSPNTAKRVTAFLAGSPGAGRGPFPELTDREREVLACVAKGLTNAATADQLFLSVKTVRNHVSNIFTKLQVVGRAQAIVKAREAGFH